MHHKVSTHTVAGLSSTSTAVSLGNSATVDTAAPNGSHFYSYMMAWSGSKVSGTGTIGNHSHGSGGTAFVDVEWDGGFNHITHSINGGNVRLVNNHGSRAFGGLIHFFGGCT
jgi:hypothetical protein